MSSPWLSEVRRPRRIRRFESWSRSRRSRRAPESLEERALLSLTVTSFPLSGSLNADVMSVTPGPEGDICFTARGAAGLVGRISPPGAVSEFFLPSTFGKFQRSDTPGPIAQGPDGNLWFTDTVDLSGPGVASVADIVRVTPAGTFTDLFQSSGVSRLGGITAGPDGNLWFTVSPNSFTVSDVGGVPEVGRITTVGSVTLFPLPLPVPPVPFNPFGGYYYQVGGITTGPDGNLWFAESKVESQADSNAQYVTGNVGRITPGGAITLFHTSEGPSDIIAGPDGELWFTESGGFGFEFPGYFQGGQVGRITTSGQLTEIPQGLTTTQSITAGPDGNLWVTEQLLSNASNGGGLLVRVTPAGTVTPFNVLPPGTSPTAITTGSDGNLWFGESIETSSLPGSQSPSLGAMGRLNLTPAPAVTSVRRSGVHLQPTTVLLTFNRPLDPTGAQDAATYAVTPSNRFGHPHGRPISVTSAVYDPSTRTVTLGLGNLLALHGYYRLTVKGTGLNALTDFEGVALDGSGAGSPGSDYTGLLHGYGVVRPATRRARTGRH